MPTHDRRRHTTATDITCPHCGALQRLHGTLIEQAPDASTWATSLQKCTSCNGWWKVEDAWRETRVIISPAKAPYGEDDDDEPERRDDQGDPGDEHDACQGRRPEGEPEMSAVHLVLYVPRGERDPEG